MPRTRIYGGRVMPYYVEPQVIEVQRSEPALPWRVTTTTSWGTNTLFQSAEMSDAMKFFKSVNLTKAGFNAQLELQRWTGSGWKTEAARNSSGQQLGDSPVETGVFAIGVVILLAAWITLS